jgi:hypothetical protein
MKKSGHLHREAIICLFKQAASCGSESRELLVGRKINVLGGEETEGPTGLNSRQNQFLAEKQMYSTD